jgi:hypothetical protein
MAATSARRRPGGAGAPIDPAHPRAAEIARLDDLADLLDSRFRIPVVGWRFGLDGVLSIIPGVGDLAAFGPALYLVWQARKLGASNGTIGRMAANAGLDFVVGSIPVLGTVFDVAFKANRRNIALLRAELERG